MEQTLGSYTHPLSTVYQAINFNSYMMLFMFTCLNVLKTLQEIAEVNMEKHVQMFKICVKEGVGSRVHLVSKWRHVVHTGYHLATICDEWILLQWLEQLRIGSMLLLRTSVIWKKLDATGGVDLK